MAGTFLAKNSLTEVGEWWHLLSWYPDDIIY